MAKTLKQTHRSNYIFKVNSENHEKFKRLCIDKGYNMSDLVDRFIAKMVKNG